MVKNDGHNGLENGLAGGCVCDVSIVVWLGRAG